MLSRAPKEISLFDVLLAMEGPIMCESPQPTAKRSSDVETAVCGVMGKVCHTVSDTLRETTLQHICDLQLQATKRTMYHI